MAAKISVLTPLLYVIVIIGSLMTFATVYRQKKMKSFANLKPWYEENFSRDLFYSLKDLSSSGTQKVPENIIKAALIKWAAEDIRQLIRMNDSKQYLTILHQRGSVGDDIWKRFITSEKLVQLELDEIKNEAEAIHPQWTQQLFQTASEVAQNEGLRKRIAEFPAQQVEYRQAFEAIRESSIKELTTENKKEKK